MVFIIDEPADFDNLMMAYKEFVKIIGGDYPSYVDMMAKKLDANDITGIEALQIFRNATWALF